jgi:TldD protein
MDALADLVPALADAVATLERLAPTASAYARRNDGLLARIDGASTAVTPVAPDAGFTLSAWTGERFIEVSCDDPSPEAVREQTHRLADRLRHTHIDWERALEPGERRSGTFAQPMREDPRALPARARIEAGRAVREALLGAPHLIEAVAFAGDVHSEIVFVDRTRQLVQELHRVRQRCFGIFAGDGTQAQLFAGHEAIGGWEALIDPARVVDEVRRDGPRVLGAPRIPDPGEHAVVMDGHFAGLFAHEAFGHGTEQDLFLKDRARGAEYLGKRVASDLVDMYDDPSNGWAASYFFDDEGAPARPTRIVAQGMLVAGINDRHSQCELVRRGMQVAKTANGRREAYDHKPYTRMTNTFFGPGTSTVEELIAGVERGYYLTHPSNGMEDPKGWGIQLEGTMAEEIVGGRLTGRVFSPVVVTGSVPRLLMSVDGVGREVVTSGTGTCGKGYKEWVKVTDGGPALRLRAVIA